MNEKMTADMTIDQHLELDSLCESAGIHWMRGEEADARMKLCEWRDRLITSYTASKDSRITELEAEVVRLREENKEKESGIQEFAHIFVEMMTRVDIDSPEWAQIKDAIKAGAEKAKAALEEQA